MREVTVRLSEVNGITFYVDSQNLPFEGMYSVMPVQRPNKLRYQQRALAYPCECFHEYMNNGLDAYRDGA